MAKSNFSTPLISFLYCDDCDGGGEADPNTFRSESLARSSRRQRLHSVKEFWIFGAFVAWLGNSVKVRCHVNSAYFKAVIIFIYRSSLLCGNSTMCWPPAVTESFLKSTGCLPGSQPRRAPPDEKSVNTCEAYSIHQIALVPEMPSQCPTCPTQSDPRNYWLLKCTQREDPLWRLPWSTSRVIHGELFSTGKLQCR